MKIIVGDTETTSKIPTAAYMLQYSGFKFDLSDTNRVSNLEYVSRYFNYDSVVPASAVEIHGLNNSKLRMLSHGDYVSDCMKDLSPFFYDKEAIFVGHNVSYDKTVIRSNLLNSGCAEPAWRGTVCTMYGTAKRYPNPKSKDPKNPRGCKLGTLYYKVCKDYNLSEQYLLDMFNEITGDKQTFHNAEWDAFCTMIIYLALRGSTF